MAHFGNHSSVRIKDHGVTTVPVVTSLDFEGEGVVISNVGSAATVTIAGTSGMNEETPVGAVDGNNTVFTTMNQSRLLFQNGSLRQGGGVDFTTSGGGLTLTFVVAPMPADSLRSFY